jgi:hypothetical protein
MRIETDPVSETFFQNPKPWNKSLRNPECTALQFEPLGPTKGFSYIRFAETTSGARGKAVG